MSDFLDYILPNQVKALSQHLATAAGLPIYPMLGVNKYAQVKGKLGYPWDINLFDDVLIYQSITEVVYTDPKQLKKFQSKTWPNGGGGIAWLPRQWNPGGFNPPLVTPDSSYQFYADCIPVPGPVKNLGTVVCKVEGPYLINFGGNLGIQSAAVQSYSYNAGFTVMEKNFYVLDFGLVQWELWNLVAGVYVLQQTAAYNMIVPGGSPELDFPCATLLP